MYGFDPGKNFCGKTVAAATPYRKKSYHSIVVPTEDEITARNCWFRVPGATLVVVVMGGEGYHSSMPRTTTTLRTNDGSMMTQVYTPDGAGPWPAAIFYCDAFGVRPQTESMAARLASNGYLVLLPDIFYRSQPIGPLDPAEGFKGGDARQKLMAIVHPTTAARGWAA